jgi:hypothetical protein
LSVTGGFNDGRGRSAGWPFNSRTSTVPAFRYGDSLPVGQLRGRNLPIPAAIFAEKLVRALEAIRAKPITSGASAAAG